MNEDVGARASAPKWYRTKSRIIPLIAALVVVAGVTTTVLTIDANNRAAAQAVAEQKADAEAKAKAQRAAEEKALSEATDRGQKSLSAGQARYAESESYGDAAKRQDLKSKIDVLAAALDAGRTDASSLEDAAISVDIAIEAVGSKAQRDAKLAADAARALDEQYTTLAASLQGNGMFPPSKGRDYCAYLNQNYKPDSATLWATSIDSKKIDVAAVRVYCPEFASRMDQVLTGFWDGNHIVGKTIPAGTYRTARGVTSCYWERNDGSGNILDNNFITSAFNGVEVTVNDGEGFSTKGCGLWVPVG